MVNPLHELDVYISRKFTIHFATQKLTIDNQTSFLILSNV